MLEYVVYIPMRRYTHLRRKIREVLDFPTPGIRFKDITPLLEDEASFREAIDGITEFLKDKKVDKIVGIDARGFLLAAPIAYLLKAGMVIVRKRGKLPHKIITQAHTLEYGEASLEVHVDSIHAGERIAIIDDVLATGGTAGAAVKLVERLGGKVVGVGFLLELSRLKGHKKLKGHRVHSLIRF